MRTLTQGPLARRKIVLIFLLAILFPALILGYLSLRAFSKRREAVRRLLESNLWISGESALRAVEAALLDHEESVLGTVNFAVLTKPGDAAQAVDQPNAGGAVRAAATAGTPFLLDEDFHILFPKTGVENPASSPVEEIVSKDEFSKVFREAETYEFSRRDFAKAAQTYRKSTGLASSDREAAEALAALGRCLISAGNLNEARRIYGELGAKYGSIRDKAGHFFGMTTAFQVYEIEKHRKRDENGLRALLDLYRGLQNGEWLVSLAEYDFFTSEIESALETNYREGEHGEIMNSYHALKRHPSPYLQSLLFAEFLKKDVVPKIRERIGISSIRGNPQPEPDRLLAPRSDRYCLVSYSPLQDLNYRKTYYRGICWDLESLKKEILVSHGDLLRETGRATGSAGSCGVSENHCGVSRPARDHDGGPHPSCRPCQVCG